MRTRLLYAFLFFSLPGFAQVTTEPALPVDGKPVRIVFDASQGTAGLKDYTGEVYAHTGVITDKSTSGSDWKYAPAWGDNSARYKLTRLTPNTYELQISPDIRSWYNVPAGEKILKMAFVFRSGVYKPGTNQYYEGKATGGLDIFVNVYEEGLYVSLTSPGKEAIVNKDNSFTIAANSSYDAALKLRSGTLQLAAATGKTISVQHAFSESGWKWIVAEASANGQTAKDSVRVFVKEPVVTQIMPAAYRRGINYTGDHSAALVLWAPFKQHVFVVGDFNGWELSNSFQMKKEGDFFWIGIDGLTKGEPYVFQYLIDGQIRIADPYTEQTCDPNDRYISAATYPGLPAYPTGKAEGVASVLQTGQPAYNWEIASFTPPATDRLVIYEMLIRDFTTDHTYRSVTEKLGYLEELGVNVLELMPVNEFEGNLSWGYNPSFYFAPDKYYGHKNELKKLIDEAHKRGMAVVIDMVLNHSYGQSPLVKMYWNSVLNRPADNNPWYRAQHNFQNPSAQWGYDFNHDSTATRQLVDSINSFWMKEYKVDGFRFDFTKGFSNKSYAADSWGNDYDPARIFNLKRMADEIQKRKPGALVIFEHLSGNTEEMELANHGILLWGKMSDKYYEGAMGYNESGKSDLTQGIYSVRGWQKPHLVSYIESHDEERLMYKCLQFGKTEGGYSTNVLGTALDRAGLSALFLVPLPGPKMIWQFGELGYDFSINTCTNTSLVRDSCRLTPKPAGWNFFENDDRKDLYKTYGRLNYLKTNYDEFSSASTYTGSLGGEVKWYRLSNGSNHVVAVGNFATSAKTANPGFPVTGSWYDYFGGNSYSVNTLSQEVPLAPGEFRLFSTRKLADPFDLSPSVEIRQRAGELVIYPNPVSERLFLRSGDYLGMVSIRDISGQLVFLGDFQKVNEAEISLEKLASGIYFVSAGNSRSLTTVKIVVN